MKRRNFHDLIGSLYPEDGLISCRNITFQVTDDCCLNCSYCYQINKGHKKMTKEIAQKAIDLLFDMYEQDDECAFINKKTHGIVLDFIGGEPLMNVAIMDFIVEYFINKCVQTDHEWLNKFRISFASNGLLYFEEEVQNFFKKYKKFIHMTITLDGPKEIHDKCRLDFNGQGSFDRSYAAMKHYWDNYDTNIDSRDNTKITIAPENLQYLNSIFDFFTKNSVKIIHANPIFETKWTIEHAKEYYSQLKEIANKMLKNLEVECTIFNEFNYKPMPTTDNRNWCGGTGNMIAISPEGNIYPCIRYMDSSLGNDCPPIVIGDVYSGIYKTEEQRKTKEELNNITRRSQSTDECFYCPIAAGCSWCSAWNYQENKQLNKRSTNICQMHRAEAIANVYYWNKRYKIEKKEKRFPFYLEPRLAMQIISEEEYNYLLELSR